MVRCDLSSWVLPLLSIWLRFLTCVYAADCTNGNTISMVIPDTSAHASCSKHGYDGAAACKKLCKKELGDLYEGSHCRAHKSGPFWLYQKSQQCICYFCGDSISDGEDEEAYFCDLVKGQCVKCKANDDDCKKDVEAASIAPKPRYLKKSHCEASCSKRECSADVDPKPRAPPSQYERSVCLKNFHHRGDALCQKVCQRRFKTNINGICLPASYSECRCWTCTDETIDGGSSHGHYDHYYGNHYHGNPYHGNSKHPGGVVVYGTDTLPFRTGSLIDHLDDTFESTCPEDDLRTKRAGDIWTNRQCALKAPNSNAYCFNKCQLLYPGTLRYGFCAQTRRRYTRFRQRVLSNKKKGCFCRVCEESITTEFTPATCDNPIVLSFEPKKHFGNLDICSGSTEGGDECTKYCKRKFATDLNAAECDATSCKCTHCRVKDPVCTYGDWTPFSRCTSKCNGGSQVRTRAPIVDPELCTNTREHATCNEQPCPVDCEIAQWTSWSACSTHCGKGSTSRWRQVIVQPQYGGRKCDYPLAERKKCLGRWCQSATFSVAPSYIPEVKQDYSPSRPRTRRDDTDYRPRTGRRYPGREERSYDRSACRHGEVWSDGTCSNEFFECNRGRAVRQICRYPSHVFDNKLGTCIPYKDSKCR